MSASRCGECGTWFTTPEHRCSFTYATSANLPTVQTDPPRGPGMSGGTGDAETLAEVAAVLHPWLDGTANCPWQAGWCPNESRSRGAAGQVLALLAERVRGAAEVVQAVRALADEWDDRLQREFPMGDYTDWHSRDLRAVLPPREERVMSAERLDAASMEDFRVMAAALREAEAVVQAVRALADDFHRESWHMSSRDAAEATRRCADRARAVLPPESEGQR